MNRRNFILLHVIPFLLAITAADALVSFTPARKYFIRHDEARPDRWQMWDTFPDYYVDLTAEKNAEQAFFYRLSQRPVVVLGSSEMTTKSLAAIPYNFFNAHGIPCVGLGHEGFQSLAMLTQLQLMHEYLDSMRLVIILSPGWFEGEYAEGTPLATFLEYNDEHFLYYANVGNAASWKPAQAHVEDYVGREIFEINSASSVLRMMAYNSYARRTPVHRALYAPFIAENRLYCEKKLQIMDSLYGGYTNRHRGDAAGSYSCPQVNWDSLEKAALVNFAAQSTNNELGISDTYYDQWMRRKPLHKVKPVAPEKNQELQDLIVLLDMLKHYHCKPLFVMQPLNPLAFSNLEALDPAIARVAQEVTARGFGFCNLYTSDRNVYKKGILSDFQHFGEYGWYKVDRAICSHFFNSIPG
jgi:D-alanine transfer protein